MRVAESEGGAALLEGATDSRADGRDIERLVEIVARPETQGLARGFERLVGSQHHDLDRRIDGLEFAEHLYAGHAVHKDVEHGNVDGLMLGQRKCLDPARRDEYVVIVLEYDTQRLARPLL